jgi:hypothetical protein
MFPFLFRDSSFKGDIHSTPSLENVETIKEVENESCNFIFNFFLHVGEVEFSTKGLFLDFQIEQLKPQEKIQISSRSTIVFHSQAKIYRNPTSEIVGSHVNPPERVIHNYFSKLIMLRSYE